MIPMSVKIQTEQTSKGFDLTEKVKELLLLAQEQGYLTNEDVRAKAFHPSNPPPNCWNKSSAASRPWMWRLWTRREWRLNQERQAATLWKILFGFT